MWVSSCTKYLLRNQSPFIAHLQNTAIQAEQLSTRTDVSIIDLFHQQEAIQRDTNALISNFMTKTHNKNNHFLANVETYDGKGDRSFLDWITQVKMFARLTLCLEAQLASLNQKA